MVKKLRKLILFVFIFTQIGYLFLFKIPILLPGETASFTNASDTLSNPRLSYRAGISSGSSGSSLITIDASGNPNNGTDHLFPKDTLCFTDSGINGCIGSTTYQVTSIINTTDFNTNTPLTNNLDISGYAIASQSATHTITFTLTNAVPSNGDILITIPAVDANTITNDKFPDTNSSIATNGFDLGGLTASDVSVSSSGCTNNWNTTETITSGTTSTDHTIRIDRQTDSCAALSTITVTVGNTNKLINPAPISSGHTQGNADVYAINLKTRDGSDSTIDQSNIKVAIIEGVLVSATIQETLTMTVAGVNTDTPSVCGQTTDVTTTATSVPWGKISSFGAFQEAAQTITVSTNADAGYSVSVEENDQMGKNGIVCAGATAGEPATCIQDTTCNTSCSESSSDDWTTTTKYGLGFSLANISGTDASFLYNESSRTFSARQFADQEVPEIKQTIMSNAGPVLSSQIYLCYRLNIPVSQPAGYYFNKVQLTATATF